MLLLFYTILIIYKHNASGAEKEIFDRNVDDIFESILGDPHEIKRKMIERGRTYKWYEQTLPPNMTAIFHSDIGFNHTFMDDIITTTTQKHIPVTPAEETDLNITGYLNHYKFRLKKIEISRLLKENDSPLPNFVKDQDNPAHITRRFDKLIAESGHTETSYRKEIYPDFQLKYGESARVFSIKTKMKDLMLHFIYVVRYKLPYMQLLRKKYKGQLKYQIGYCFALLRHLRQQQKNLYSALMDYYKMMNNLLIHMKIYEKVVRLDVDIRDVCKLIKMLNYKRQLEDDSGYYDDSPEAQQPPLESMGEPHGKGPVGPQSNERKIVAPPGGQSPPGGLPPGGLPPGGLPPGGLPPGYQGRRAMIAYPRKPTNLSRRARPDIPKASSLSRKLMRRDTPKAASLSQSAIKTDTFGTFNKRNMTPFYHGFPMQPQPGPKLYRMQELGRKSMSALTLPPPTLKNGRRLYAPLPDGMRL